MACISLRRPNPLTITSEDVGFTITGGTVPKTLTVDVDFDCSTPGGGIGSNPLSGQYRVKGIRLDANKEIVVTYDGTPEP